MLSQDERQRRIGKLTETAMLFALALMLSLIEGGLPPVPFLPPGAKLGFSNIVVMAALLGTGVSPALILALLKGGFALLTRGLSAGLLSLGGGVLSILVMALLMLPKKHMASVFLLSVFGAAAHNIGQLFVASFWIGSFAAMAYFPWLILFGTGMGVINGLLLKAVLPALEKARHGIKAAKSGKIKRKQQELKRTGEDLDGDHERQAAADRRAAQG